MEKVILRPLILLLLSLALLTGCQNDSREEEITPISLDEIRETAPDESEAPIEIEGNLVPRFAVNLAFAIPGTVQEVLVTEGESVAEGQVLATIGERRQAEAVVKAGELELLMAQQDLEALYDNHAALETETFLTLVSSRQDVEDAEELLDLLTGERLEIETAAAEAQLVLALDNLEAAQGNLAEAESEDEASPTRATLQLRLAEARRSYDEAVRQLDRLRGDGYAFRLQQAEDMLQASQDQLALAEERYDKASAGPDAGALALAEARVASAEAGLAAAREGLEKYELRAPMASTVVALALKAGEQVAAGQPVGQLADLSAWIVETLDLTEIDVVSVNPAQSVLVTADALPDVTMTGTVLSISAVPRDVRGDVTYLARIRLDAADPRLRWGMTVLIKFQ